MAESLALDPSEVATGRTELGISSGAIRIAEAGVDYGDAEISAYMAEQFRGEAPIDYRVPNRHISIPLIIQTSGTVSFAQARTKLQAKAALIQREGGWLRRVTAGGGTLFMDVVNATLHLPGGWLQSTRDIENEAVLSLEAKPDFYGAELTLSDHIETTAAELVFTETGIKGDYPGRVRIVVDNDQATSQLGLIWGFRSRRYSSASTAASKYEAETMTPLDLATKTSLAGASGGTVIKHNSLPTSWTPVMNTNIAGTSFLTHVGTYRVFARCYSTSGTTVQARLAWDVGDLVLPAENDPWTFPGASAFYIADLGEIRLDQVPVGTHRWQGEIQAQGAAGTENISVDKVWIVNADEGMGVLKAPMVVQATSTATFGPRSGATFADDATVGTLTWTSPSNAAASDDSRATVAAGASGTTHYLKATNFGFVIPSGATINGIVIEVERSNGAPADKAVVDAAVRIVKGGAIQATDRSAAGGWPTSDAYQTYGGATDLWGASWVYTDINASTFGVAIAASRTDGAGAPRIDHIRITVYYTPAVVPGNDAVLYASHSAQLCHNGMYRQDTGGSAYGPVSNVIGDLPRIPPAGLEARTCEVFLKASRSDLDTIADSAMDDISAQMFYRPSWLIAPDA